MEEEESQYSTVSQDRTWKSETCVSQGFQETHVSGGTFQYWGSVNIMPKENSDKDSFHLIILGSSLWWLKSHNSIRWDSVCIQVNNLYLYVPYILRQSNFPPGPERFFFKNIMKYDNNALCILQRTWTKLLSYTNGLTALRRHWENTSLPTVLLEMVRFPFSERICFHYTAI